MATQGQRRQEARNAIRKLRQGFRTSDTAAERVERELDRLIKRKTMVSADQLSTLSNRLVDYIKLVEDLQRLYAIIFGIISRLPI